MDRRRAQTVCVAGLAITGIYSLALIPVAPTLLGRDPILLEFLRGSTPAMVAGGAFARVGDASLLVALLAPLPTLLMADPLLWWAGRLWGRDAAHMLAGRGPRARRWTARAERWAERYGSWAVALSYFLPVPSALVYAAAGWSGMRLPRFLALSLVGTSLWAAVNVGLGYALGESAVGVAKGISRYGLMVSLALIAVIFVFAYRRAAREGVGPPPVAGEPEPAPAREG